MAASDLTAKTREYSPCIFRNCCRRSGHFAELFARDKGLVDLLRTGVDPNCLFDRHDGFPPNRPIVIKNHMVYYSHDAVKYYGRKRDARATS